jgi:hypothetical protein
LGRIIVDRLAGSPEGPFLGAYILGAAGAETPLDLPVENLGFAGVWSPDADRLLVNAFDGNRVIVGMLDPAAGTFDELSPEGMRGEVECTDWAPDAQRVICGRSGSNAEEDGIYSVEVASGDSTRLTTSPFHHVVGTAGECGGGEGRATYSPDGRQFAFIQQKCGAGANPSSDE